MFTFGGADSIDKQFRKEGESWWTQEIPTEEEIGKYTAIYYRIKQMDIL